MGALRENLEQVRAYAATKEEPPIPALPERVFAAAEKWADDALSKRLNTIRDTCSGSTFAVLKDLEATLKERTEQLAGLQRNYDGLHSICEEYHQQIEALRGQAATRKDNEDAVRALKKEAAEQATRLAAADGLRSQLEAAEQQLAAAREQVASQASRLEESSKSARKLQAAAKAAEAKAAAAGEAIERKPAIYQKKTQAHPHHQTKDIGLFRMKST